MSGTKTPYADLQVGDEIQCRDEDDMIDTMMELTKLGIDTEWDIPCTYKLTVTEVWR